MKLPVPLTLLACLCLTSHAWGGLVVAGNASPIWLSINATVVLTQFSCVYRPALQGANFPTGAMTSANASRTGQHSSLRTGGAGGRLTGSSNKNVTLDLPPVPPFSPGVDEQITRPFTPGIDDQVSPPAGVFVSTTQVHGAGSNPSPGTAGPSTEQIVTELAGDPFVTNIGTGQGQTPQGAGIATTHTVPEPGSLALLALGLFALISGRFRHRLK